MEATASARYLRGSAQKARLVVDMIRGKDVNQALAILRFSRKRAAESTCSTGASGRVAGPSITDPSTAKREPWHGQSHVVSALFHATMHPRCVHTADTS